ncbi:hypothetical protein CK5_20110 [Blautia obeum A2-162]|uniref:Uncharacterized protein n=1 Tax=Blautia obeum A2-162 TaxID=657314 RepID=D4LRI1_9FIRM|nr:hypothetical protein CK5_20110 [Blautia obeum A2-162]
MAEMLFGTAFSFYEELSD